MRVVRSFCLFVNKGLKRSSPLALFALVRFECKSRVSTNSILRVSAFDKEIFAIANERSKYNAAILFTKMLKKYYQNPKTKYVP